MTQSSLFDRLAVPVERDPIHFSDRSVTPVPHQTKPTLCQKLADHFRARPHIWIDGRDLMSVAGSYAWRSRVADLRFAPFAMRIENRQERHSGYVLSFYKFIPEEQR